ncbi:MAG: ABC transporter permease [Candidatus Didemnitutus sp.]|nr:ABC transporter permease [Candidatus Didemnitutus sp.]
MLNDLRFALRQLTRHRWFSLAVIVTLALGIGINTTVFTLVNAVLFKPLPIPGGERLAIVTQDWPEGRLTRGPLSLPEFRAYQSQNRTFDGLEAIETSVGVIAEPGVSPERYNLGVSTTGLFGLVKAQPILGRALLPSDGAPGAPLVVLLSHKVWQHHYAGALDVVGRSVRLNTQPATIIGVMPEGFRFPGNQDLWTALTPTNAREDRANRNLVFYGLLKSGVTAAEAQADCVVIASRLAQQFPDTNKDYVPRVQTFHEQFAGGPVRLIFLFMLGAVGFVLLIACANVANLTLSRALARQREISVRAALGASRSRLMRQLLVESVLLSVIGGAFGLGLALAGAHVFDLATQDIGRPYWIDFAMDWRAFAYISALSVAAGLVFGLVPAWRASRVDLNTAMKDGTAGSATQGGKLTAALVVFQFAVTVILLASAGLMVRNFFAVQQMNPFIPAREILAVRLSLPDGPGERYHSGAARQAMHERLQQRLAAVPGVTHAVLTSDFPGLGAQQRAVEIEGKPAADPKQPFQATATFCSPDYLPAINLPVLVGRGLNDTDGVTGKEAAVVTRQFAARYWEGESPIGRRFRLTGLDGKVGPWVTVVGVSGDIVQSAQQRNAPPLAFLSNRQEPWAWIGVLLRTQRDPTSLAASVRAAVQELDPDLPLLQVYTLKSAIEQEHWFLAIFGSLFFTFAAIALLMASVGLYAVVAQNTARRTREIGIRMALGATTDRVVRLMLGRGLAQLGVGLALGFAGALAAAKLMANMIGSVSPRDPLVFLSIALLLSVIGLLACWLPARRAARVAPTEALRAE